MKDKHSHFHDALHACGLKITPLRVALLEIFEHEHSPLSFEDIEKRLRSLAHDPASLFRSLKTFSQANLIKVVDLGEGFLRYEGICEEHTHHHHVQCSNCKKIEVLPFCIPKEIEQYLSKSGYTHLTHRLDFSGLCKACSKGTK